MAFYDMQAVRSAAAPRWVEILSQIGAIRPDWLDGRSHPCPKCGGKDRFRLIDREAGAVLCNQCFRSGNGDGFAALQWLTGHPFSAILPRVAAACGISPIAKSKAAEIDPAKDLEFRDWNESIVSLWCLKKPGILPQALRAVGARLATYRKHHTVIALPVWGEHLDQADPVGWCLFAANGVTLPKFSKDKKTEQVKVKLTYGSRPGVIGVVRRGSLGIKTEGPTDLLALLSLADLPPDLTAVCNANGAGENPDNTPWIAELFRGMSTWVVQDCDIPGQQGATEVPRADGTFRPGWSPCIARTASECRNVVLPYPIAKDHGPDLRDWLREPHTFADLSTLASGFSAVPPAPLTITPPKVNEGVDDPHRLARVNLDRYGRHKEGATIRYWRDEWFTWKPERGCYRTIGLQELRAKVIGAIKEEFDRVNLEEIEDYQEKKKAGEITPENDKGPPIAKKISQSLIANVLAAMADLTLVSSSIEPMTWLGEDGSRQRRNFVALVNGVLDIDQVMKGGTVEECLQPHSPRWFSTVRLPYRFDSEAKCPKWEAFLEKNLELDPERIKLLQEWAGYCLLPDTGEQKFLVLEGEGSNGKSVYMAAITALLGEPNCSHIPLEIFGDRFAKSQTIGKLVNISADVGELDKVAEGYLKSFTSGDVMYFDRKGISGLDCTPTARLMVACNNRPRFSDRSSGVWRRMLLVPFRVEIQRHERVRNMDKPWWWEQSGELPGIFNWALMGLARLRAQGGFTESQLSVEALEDYRIESNPAREFLLDNCELASGIGVKSSFVYSLYVHWCQQTGHRPLNDRSFGKEIYRCFKNVERKKVGSRAERYWVYQGLGFSCDEICGQKTYEGNIF